jgi:hypothetical protein
VVNRFWKQFFGAGLSAVVDDLGTQGEWPSHPELLDWLAVEFEDSGWDVKHIVKLMVLSSTYRQQSGLRPEMRESDPNNRLLSCQSPRRWRRNLCVTTRWPSPACSTWTWVGRAFIPTNRRVTTPICSFPTAATRPIPASSNTAAALYSLAADLSAAGAGEFRRALARGMHLRAQCLQHAAAGADAAERPDLRRGGAGTGAHLLARPGSDEERLESACERAWRGP